MSKSFRLHMLALILHIAETRRTNLEMIKKVSNQDILDKLWEFDEKLSRSLADHIHLYEETFGHKIIKL